MVQCINAFMYMLVSTERYYRLMINATVSKDQSYIHIYGHYGHE